jgi:hypothetical protein
VGVAARVLRVDPPPVGGPSRAGPVLALVLVLAFALRGWMAVATPLVYDEYQWIAGVDRVSLDPGRLHLPLHGDQHPPGQVYWAYLGKSLFAGNLLGYRIASVVLGTIAVLLAFRLGCSLGGVPAGLIAAFLWAANEYQLGASRLCTEKTYVTFALLALLLVRRILEKPSTRRFVLLGAALGLGACTKQILWLWIPPIAWLLLRRGGGRALLRTAGPWWGAAAFVLAVAPDLAWNLALPGGSGAEGSRGIVYQLGRLHLGAWSWGPLALYVRPLFYQRVEGTISEYASMTTAPGILLLAGAAASLFLAKDGWARFLQALGFGTMLFFSIAAPGGEFWWADLSLACFVPLAGAVLSRMPGPRWATAAALAALVGPPALHVASARDNYFPLDWGSPPPPVVETYRNSQRFLFVQFPGRDHAALCTIGSWRLPAFAFYRDAAAAYRDYVDGLAAGDAPSQAVRRGYPLVPRRSIARERAWAAEASRRFDREPGER